MTQTQTPSKPVPQPDEVSRPFFEGAARGVLMIQQCDGCRAFLAPGSRVCTECLNESLTWVAASGRATLFTFAIMHQRYHPGFFEDLPYNIAVVELEEGPRLNTTIVGLANDDLKVGLPLTVTFEQVGEGVSLPKFQPV